VAKDDMSWMDALTKPSRKGFRQYLRSQQGQFAPMIGTLLNQLRSTKPGQDPTVLAYERLLKGLPSAESVSGSYRSRLDSLASYMQGLDTARGGRAVTDIIGSVGGMRGVEGAADVAGAAGTVSGVGGGDDSMYKALMQGAAARFAGLESERLGQLAGQRQELALGAGQARSAVQQQRQELGRMIAEARGQRMAATPNPFELASMIMQYQDAMKSRTGTSSGKSETTKDDDKPPWYDRYGFKNKPGISKKDMKQMWNMSTGYGK